MYFIKSYHARHALSTWSLSLSRTHTPDSCNIHYTYTVRRSFNVYLKTNYRLDEYVLSISTSRFCVRRPQGRSPGRRVYTTAYPFPWKSAHTDDDWFKKTKKSSKLFVLQTVCCWRRKPLQHGKHRRRVLEIHTYHQCSQWAGGGRGCFRKNLSRLRSPIFSFLNFLKIRVGRRKPARDRNADGFPTCPPLF